MNLSITSQELLRDYSRLEYLLLGDLRSILDEPEETRDAKWLMAVLDSLVDTIPREFELREEGGYMSDLLEREPCLADVIGSLQSEHARIFSMLADLRRRVGLALNTTAIADQLGMELRDWMQLLMKHNRRERSVFQTAYNMDVGGRG